MVYKVDTAGNVTPLAGNGNGTVVNGNGASAEFFNPIAPAVDSAGNIYVSEWSNSRVTKGTLDPNTLTITWPGSASLESATNLAGPYTPVPGSTSPFIVVFPTANPQTFYRLW
jgi:hypothetical protein